MMMMNRLVIPLALLALVIAISGCTLLPGSIKLLSVDAWCRVSGNNRCIVTEGTDMTEPLPSRFFPIEDPGMIVTPGGGRNVFRTPNALHWYVSPVANRNKWQEMSCTAKFTSHTSGFNCPTQEIELPCMVIDTANIPPTEDAYGPAFRVDTTGSYAAECYTSYDLEITYDIPGAEPEPEPEPPSPPSDPWSAFIGVFRGLWNWFTGLFSPGTIVSSGQTAVPGDTFQHTFTLTNTKGVVLPDTYYQDKDRTWLYYGYAVFDPSGNIVGKSITEITDPLDPLATVTLPMSYDITDATVSGKYVVIATLMSVTSTYGSGQWTESQPEVIDKQATSFQVQGITPPPAPSFDIGQLFAGIKNWFCSTFGMFCS
jgi:hypothetical protein